MPIKAYTPEEIDLYVKFVLYSPEGWGKTTWLAQNMPDPIDWIDFERSSDSIVVGRRKGIIPMDKDIRIYPINTSVDIEEVKKHCLETFPRSQSKTLVFDTLSTSQTHQLQHWMKQHQNKDGMPLWKDYRKSTTIFNEILLGLQHVPKHVVIVAHEKEYYETVNDANGEHKKLIHIGPQVTPALADSVRQIISGVIRLQRKSQGNSVKWTMLVNPKDKYKAKNRYGLSATEYDDPTWDLFENGVIEHA